MHMTCRYLQNLDPIKLGIILGKKIIICAESRFREEKQTRLKHDFNFPAFNCLHARHLNCVCFETDWNDDLT